MVLPNIAFVRSFTTFPPNPVTATPPCLPTLTFITLTKPLIASALTHTLIPLFVGLFGIYCFL